MSLRIDRSEIAIGPNGAVAHRDLIDHGDRFDRHLHEVRAGRWCHVGDGLSSITFEASLRIRHGVAVRGHIDDDDDDVILELDLPTWARLYGGATTAAAAEADGALAIAGDRSLLARFFGAFDHPHLVVGSSS